MSRVGRPPGTATDRWVLFDLDGCLIDSSVAIPYCLNAALLAADRPQRDPFELQAFIGPPLAATFRHLLAGPDGPPAAAEVDRALATYRDVFDQVAAGMTAVVAGIPELLSSLSQRRAIVTSKPRHAAAPLVTELGLDPLFEAVHGPGHGVEDEAKATTLGRALEELGIAQPSLATMVGDRHHDVEAGRRLGCATIGVTWGAGDRDELVDAGADHVVDDPRQLSDLLTRG